LNLVIIFGLCLLLQDLYPELYMVHTLFSFPYYFVTAAAVLFVNIRIAPIKVTIKEKKKHIFYIPIIIYSVAALILFLYSHYIDVMF
jgi:hypothetical membrane protein